MADIKEKHYWEQLQSALTAGQWDSSTPARTPKGVLLSWSELFRKFRKHTKRNGGYISVPLIVGFLIADRRGGGCNTHAFPLALTSNEGQWCKGH